MLEAGCPLCGAVLPLTELGSHLLLHSHFACALCDLEGKANEVTLHAILSGHSATKLVCREQTLTTLLQQLQQGHFVFSKSGIAESTADDATNSRSMATAATASVPSAHVAQNTDFADTTAKITPNLASETGRNTIETPLKAIATSKAVSEQPTIKHPLTVEEDTSYSVIAEDEDDGLKPPTKKSKLTSASQLADHENISTDDPTKSGQVECKKCELLLEKRSACLMTHIFSMKHDAFPPRQFQCLTCDQCFLTPDRFLSHRKNEHNGAAQMKMNISLDQIISEIRASYSESHADRIGPLITSRLARLTNPSAREPSPIRVKSAEIPAKSEQETDSLDSSHDSTKSGPTENEQGSNESTERLVVIREATDVDDSARAGAVRESPESRNACVKCRSSALKPREMVDHILSIGHGVFSLDWVQCSLCPASYRSRRSFFRHNIHDHNKEAAIVRNPHVNIDHVSLELETAFPSASSITYSSALRSFENINVAHSEIPPKTSYSASKDPTNKAETKAINVNATSTKTDKRVAEQPSVALEEDTSYSVIAEEEDDDLKPPAKKTKLSSSSPLAAHENTSTDDSTKSRQVECKKCQVFMDKRPGSTMGHIFSIRHCAFPSRQFQCLACGQDFQTEDSFILHRKTDHGGAALMKMGVSLEQIMAEIRASYSESQADRLHPLILSRLDRLTKPQLPEQSEIQAKSDEESNQPSHSPESNPGSKNIFGTEAERESAEFTQKLVINEEMDEENATQSDASKSDQKCEKCVDRTLRTRSMAEHVLSQSHGAFSQGWLQCSLCTVTARSRSAFLHHNANYHNKEAENLRNPRINIQQVLQELKTSFPNAPSRVHFNAMRSFENVEEATPTGLASNAPFSVQEDFDVIEKGANTDKDDSNIAVHLSSDHEGSYECSEEEQEITKLIDQNDKTNIKFPEEEQALLDLEPIIKKAAADLVPLEGSDQNQEDHRNDKYKSQEQEVTKSGQNDAPKVKCTRCKSEHGLRNKAHLLEHVLSKSHGVFPNGLFACTTCDKTFKFEYRHRSHAEKEHNGAAESRALVTGTAFLTELDYAFPSIPWKEQSSLCALLNKLGD